MAIPGNDLTEAAATGLSANGEGKHVQMLSALQILEVPLALTFWLMAHAFCMGKVTSWFYLKCEHTVNQAVLGNLLLRATWQRNHKDYSSPWPPNWLNIKFIFSHLFCKVVLHMSVTAWKKSMSDSPVLQSKWTFPTKLFYRGDKTFSAIPSRQNYPILYEVYTSCTERRLGFDGTQAIGEHVQREPDRMGGTKLWCANWLWPRRKEGRRGEGKPLKSVKNKKWHDRRCVRISV